MVLCDFAAASLMDAGGSALTNSSRPLESTVLAIWAFAPGTKKPAHKANVPRYLQAVDAVRLAILPRERLLNVDSIIVFGAALCFRADSSLKYALCKSTLRSS